MDCEFVLDNKDGHYLKCNRTSDDKIARCMDLCFTHYNAICRDNKKRVKRNYPLTDDCSLLKMYTREKYTCLIEVEKPKPKEIIPEIVDPELFQFEILDDDKEYEFGDVN